MDIRTALLRLREELGMKQVELAGVLGVNAVTVNRWETGKNPPSRSMSMSIIAYAKANGVSNVCIEMLKSVLLPTRDIPGIDNLKYAELDQINNLVNDSSNAVFVYDSQTYELLYVNRRVGLMTGKDITQAAGKKCYEYIFGRSAPCDFCAANDPDADGFGTMEYESPDTGRYYMGRGKPTMWSGRPAHIEYITDMTAFHTVCRELEHNRELMTAACQDAGMWVFLLDVATGAAHLEKAIQDFMKLPEFLPDIFAQVIEKHIIAPEDADKLNSMIAMLRAGEESAETVVRALVYRTSAKPHWVRLRARTVERDADGRPLLATCSAQVIDNEMAMEARIRFEHEHTVGSRNDLMGYVISNISKNRIVEQKRIRDDGPEARTDVPFDEGVRIAVERIESGKEREQFLHMHDREALLASFAAGELVQTIDYQVMQQSGTYVWVSDQLKLMLNPVDGDIYMYEYCFNSHVQKIVDGFMAWAMHNKYDIFGAVSLLDGRLTKVTYCGSGVECTPVCADYESDAHIYSMSLPAEERDAFIEKTRLSTVADRLSESEVYYVSFRRDDGDGRLRTKVAQFTWYDRESRFCLVTVIDMEKYMALAASVEKAGVSDSEANK